MKEAHRDILSKVIHAGGWKKVYDKNFKITHRAVYFNSITEKSSMQKKVILLVSSRLIKSEK